MKEAMILSNGMNAEEAVKKIDPEHKMRDVANFYKDVCMEIIGNSEKSAEDKSSELREIAEEMNTLYYDAIYETYASGRDKLLRAIFGKPFTEEYLLEMYKTES